MYHLRAIFKSGSDAGKVLDQFYDGASFSSIWMDAQTYVDEIVSETIEMSEIIYTAKWYNTIKPWKAQLLLR